MRFMHTGVGNWRQPSKIYRGPHYEIVTEWGCALSFGFLGGKRFLWHKINFKTSWGAHTGLAASAKAPPKKIKVKPRIFKFFRKISLKIERYPPQLVFKYYFMSQKSVCRPKNRTKACTLTPRRFFLAGASYVSPPLDFWRLHHSAS